MPVVQTHLPIPKVMVEDFEYIPDTGSYVATYKLADKRGSIISNVQGYEMVQIAQNLGLYLASSEEWGKSRRHFQSNPDKKFKIGTGSKIEKNYISGHIEQTGSFLSFRGEGEFPGDTHDLLKEAGFDGRIALIDFPYVQENGDGFIFIRSPRVRIRDVTEINGKPFPITSGYVNGYDWETGLITEVGPKANSDFHDAFCWIKPKETRMVICGGVCLNPHERRRFYVVADWTPSDSDEEVSARLSSENKPSKTINTRMD